MNFGHFRPTEFSVIKLDHDYVIVDCQGIYDKKKKKENPLLEKAP